jgi:hypothetical protein
MILTRHAAAGPEKIEHWITQIQAMWSAGSSGVLELARVVKEAHEALRPYRAWSWLCTSQRLPFRKSKAKYLLFIGKRLVGTVDGQTFGHLPHEVTVLYELAHLEPEEIKRWLDELLIRPNMDRAEAKALVARFRGRPVSPREKRRDPLKWLERAAECIRDDDNAHWPPYVLRAAERKAKAVVKLIQLRRKREESKRGGADAALPDLSEANRFGAN